MDIKREHYSGKTFSARIDGGLQDLGMNEATSHRLLDSPPE